MFPVTIVIIALHIIFAIRLIFFKSEIKNTAKEPTLLQILLAGALITVGAVYVGLSKNWSWFDIVILLAVWFLPGLVNAKKSK